MSLYYQRYVDESGFRIKTVKARRVLDSRGNPTLSVKIITEAGGVGIAYAPSGASKGKFEAVEVRDGGSRFHGRDVSKAIENVERIIAPSIVGLDSRKQRLIDEKIIMIDGTGNKSRLGSNATVATSLAVAKAAASTYGLPLYAYLGGTVSNTLPVPMLNVINGGVHAGNKLDFQEYMIVPAGFDNFSEALRASVEVYHVLKNILKDRYGASAINVGDEGGFAPPIDNNLEPLNILVEAISKAGYSPGGDIALALDVASTQLYDVEKKAYRFENSYLTREDMIELYLRIVDQYPI
ncbi:MAG: phosphopyruvate hydratase, partial [Desulfurococcaceae archaeon]